MGCWCFTGMKCESDLECRFWWHIQYSRAFLLGLWESQVRVGQYRVDALARVDEWRVAFELDGKAFHNPQDDKRRDASLLNHIDAVVHIPFAAMAYYPEATWMLVGTWFPPLTHFRAPGFAMTTDELSSLLAACDNGEEPNYLSGDSWLDREDANYEVYCDYGDAGGGGVVGSPKAFCRNWKTSQVYVVRDRRKWLRKGWALGRIPPDPQSWDAHDGTWRSTDACTVGHIAEKYMRELRAHLKTKGSRRA